MGPDFQVLFLGPESSRGISIIHRGQR